AQPQPGKKGGDRTWKLTLPRSGRLTLRLTGKGPLARGGKIRMPELTVEGLGTPGARRARWVAIGEELRAAESQGLEPLKDLRGLPLGELDSGFGIGSAWSVKTDNWRLVLVPRPTAAAPVQVLHAEQHAEVVDGRRWLHQATYLLHVRGGELRLTLPTGASLLSLTLDGQPLPYRPGGSDQFSLPLPGGSGTHTLRLTWTFADGSETLEGPNLTPVRLLDVGETPTVWVVHTPPGYRLARPSSRKSI